MAGERAAASSAYGPLAMCFRGGIAAGETGYGRIAAGKRQTDQNMVILSAQKVDFWGEGGVAGEAAKSKDTARYFAH